MAALLQVANVKKYFPAPRGWKFWHNAGEIKSVDDVSFEIEEGTTFGLVGESGSGKAGGGPHNIILTGIPNPGPVGGRLFCLPDIIVLLSVKNLIILDNPC